MVAQIDETTRSFYRVPKVVVHKGEKGKKLTEKRRKKMACKPTSENACVCSDHFIKGELTYVAMFV